MNRDVILKEALSLPTTDRLEIADRLYQSLDDATASELTAAQRADLKKRLEEHRAGKSNPMPWEVFREQLLKRQ